MATHRDMDGTHVGLWNDGLVYNAPMHRECYEASRSLCPHLQRVEPLAVIEHEGGIEFYGCTTIDRRFNVMAMCTIGEAIGLGQVGRELIVRLAT